ncbi:hypothetical protein F5Y04DRAFT_45423 [Hypomontagnella monticulosa]|nr:hypothetical protein F5Y04DRAFT_45423 [Hypomontagnella monticulosa]
MAPPAPEQLPADVSPVEDIRGQTIASVVVCMVLAIVALIMRLVSRRIKKLSLMLSDYFAIAGTVCAFVTSLLVVYEARHGLGLHNEFVPSSDVTQILLATFAGELTYTIGFTLVKLSIIALYRQLFPTRLMLTSTTILAVLVTMWGIALVLVSIFSCNPISGFWDHSIPSTCINLQWFYIGNAIPNILTDAALLCLPMRDIWSVRLDRHSKVAVSILFALGSFVIVASGLRIHFMLTLDSNDLTWSYVGGELWTAIELDIGVVCCCLATSRPVLSCLFPESAKKLFRPNSIPATNAPQNYNFHVPNTRHPIGSPFKVPDSPGGGFIPLKDSAT